MSEEVSSGDDIVDLFKKHFPDSMTLEVKKHSFGIGSEGTAISVDCDLVYDLFSGTDLVAGENELRDVAIQLTLRRDEAAYDEVKEKGAIGYLSYSDAMKSDDGVIDSDAGVEGAVVLPNDLFDRIFPLIRQGDPGARIRLYVENLKRKEEWAPVSGHSWDVREKPNLHILNFSYYVPSPGDEEEVAAFDFDEEDAADLEQKTCRFCAEDIKATAEVCPHCGKNQELPELIQQWILAAYVLACTGFVAYLLFKFSQRLDIQPVDSGTTLSFFLMNFLFLAIIGTIPFYAWMRIGEGSPELPGTRREEPVEFKSRGYIGCYTILVLGGSLFLSLISTILEAREFLFTALKAFFSG